MDYEDLEQYFEESIQLKEQFKSKINLRFGLELDFSSLNNLGYITKYKKYIDYLIAGIHTLKDKEIIDSKSDTWRMNDKKFIEKYYNNDFYQMEMEYYKKLQRFIDSNNFDIVAHFDVIKKVVGNGFDETIENEIIKTLEIIKKRRKVVEINTGGLREEFNETSPGESIIKIINNLDIPILLSSDAHNPEDVAYEFENTMNSLKKIGFTQLAHFKKRKLSFIEI